MNKSFCTIVAVLLAGSVTASEQPSLELIMSDPDWIGAAPEGYYWADQGDAIYYQQKRQGEDIRDLFHQSLDSRESTAVSALDARRDSGIGKVYDLQRVHVAWIHEGDVLLKDLASGTVIQVTATSVAEASPLFSTEGEALTFLSEGQFFQYDMKDRSTRQTTDIQLEADPDAAPDFDALQEQQLRTYSTLVEEKRRKEARQVQQRTLQAENPLRAPLPIYLGKDVAVVSRHLSPSGQYLALVIHPSESDEGRKGLMPNYVTEDGYVATREVRSRVNRQAAVAQSLILIDLQNSSFQTLDISRLAGIESDPLKELRESAVLWHVNAGADREQVEKALEAPAQRSVTFTGVKWNGDGTELAVQLLATDYKDRWLVTVDLNSAAPRLQHRLTDNAWINWSHNDFGWLPDQQTLWYLSEESGYLHLYTKHLNERRHRQLTKGQYVVIDPQIEPTGNYAYVVANRAHPGNYEIYRVSLKGGELEQVTDLDGVSSFVLSPSGDKLLVARSWMDRHPDLYVTSTSGEHDLRQLTDTVSDRYASIDWVIPEIVEVPSSQTPRPIYSKLYLPGDFDPAKSYPAVMFVHGAGYTQNAHFGWPYYFREFMFHTVLANEGFIVLDMDYRASRGYGRDWRTAIYRNMGHPELEDYLDGVEYLVANHAVDRKRIGIYGGSYGGFMTFMALFRAPEVFAAGAALRPVVDWMHYTTDYTMRILNTPEIDPEAYQLSSPINYAENLQTPLLIATGMQDDNVFFQDSVLMVQRLIELKKQDFEMAVYPLDGHGFKHPESWLDEYRRIYKLMKANLQ